MRQIVMASYVDVTLRKLLQYVQYTARYKQGKQPAFTERTHSPTSPMAVSRGCHLDHTLKLSQGDSEYLDQLGMKAKVKWTGTAMQLQVTGFSSVARTLLKRLLMALFGNLVEQDVKVFGGSQAGASGQRSGHGQSRRFGLSNGKV